MADSTAGRRDTSAQAGLVDWTAATDFAAKLIPAGPRLPKSEAQDLVADLRAAAEASVEPILETTRMRPAPGLPQDRFGQVLVVDRANWAASNISMMAQLTEPVLAGMARLVPSTAPTQLGAGAEVAAMMAVMAPRVLGQFDPYSALHPNPVVEQPLVVEAPQSGGHETTPVIAGSTRNLAAEAGSTRNLAAEPSRQGQLLLIAPNVAQTEKQLDVDPADFRLWVCLHEQTHGLQFAAAPWLSPFMYAQIGGLLDAMTQKAVATANATFWQKLIEAFTVVRDLTRGLVQGGPAPFEVLLGADAQEKFGTVSAVMALLEGHADVMMDEVGPAVVPTVAEIREKFENRRDGKDQPAAGVALRKLLGMDAKLAQYRDGARFVRGVEELVGRDGFNAIWTSPETLPLPGEIVNPAAWVRRIHG